MIDRLAISLAVLLFGTLTLHGQVLQGIISDTHHSGGGGYTGPGDVKSGAVSFYSTIRAYNAAYATGSNPAYTLCTSTGCGLLQTVNILTTGRADLTTANAFVPSCPGGTTCFLGAMNNQIAASFDQLANTSAGNLPTYAPTSFSGTYGAASFDGSINFFTRTANQGPQTAYTNCAIVNFVDVAHVYVINTQYGNGVQVYSQFFILSDGSITARIASGNGSTYIGRTTAASAASTGYHQYCYTWSGGTTAAAIKIYKGSTQVDTTDDTAGSFSAPNSNSIIFELGAQNGGALVKADIIEQMEWPVELSGGEITSVCNTIPGGCI